MKRFISMVLSMVMIFSIIGFVPDFEEKVNAASTISIGQYVQMGSYYDEPILWRCVDIDEDGPLMLSDKILTVKPFDAAGNHPNDYDECRLNYGSNLWETSNIRSWLNSTASAGNVSWLCGNPPTSDKVYEGYNSYANEKGFLANGNFTFNEQNAIKSVVQKSILNARDATNLKSGGTELLISNEYTTMDEELSMSLVELVLQNYDKAYYQNVIDKIFLMDIRQVYNVYQNSKILGENYYLGKLTQKAVDNSEFKESSTSLIGHYTLRCPEQGGATATRCVSADGNLSINSASFGIGIRPAFYINISSVSFESGNGSVSTPFIIREAKDATNENIKWVVELKLYYDRIESFSELLACVSKGNKYGYINTMGDEIIPVIYDHAENFSEGCAAVLIDSKWKFIDNTGKDIIVLNYDWVYPFYEGVAMVRNDMKYGFIDKTGKEVIPLIYDKAERFNEGLAPVEKNGKYGLIDREGKEVVSFIYGNLGVFSEGLSWFSKDGKFGYIDKAGKERISLNYDFGMVNFSESFASVKRKGKCGFIDNNGDEVIPLTYDDVRSFSEGLAAVENNWRYGFIDKTGKEVIPLIYDGNDGFSEGLARVVVSETNNNLVYYKQGFIDKAGKQVIPLVFDYVGSFSEGLAVVKKDSKWGIIANPLTGKLTNLDIQISVIYNGTKIAFDQQPIIENGRTLVPMRAIFEALGCEIIWNEEKQSILAIKEDREITMQIGRTDMYLYDKVNDGNSHVISLDVAPEIINGRTLVPVRAIGEALDCEVNWDGSTNTVIITN